MGWLLLLVCFVLGVGGLHEIFGFERKCAKAVFGGRHKHISLIAVNSNV